jgi:hypothetical protein
MIHRRKAETDASDTGNGNVSAAPSSPPMANPTVNASFTPLRRPHRTSPSATYGVNGVFGAAQGYESPRNGSGFSPVLNTNGNGFGAGSYGAYGSGSGSWGRAFEDDEVKPPATPVEFARRAAGQVKAGVLDAVRVDRSWGLVWG